MDNTSTATSPASLHPVLWIAAISVTLLSLAGVAALTGFLPFKSAPAPERPAIVAAAPASEPTVAPVAPLAPVATPQATAAPVSQAPAVIHHKAPRKKGEHGIAASAAAVPPPLAGGVPPDYVPAAVAAPAPPAPCPDCGVIASETMPSWRIGDKVKLIAGAIVSR